jgi:biopolymer transport protein ExbD
MALQLHTEEDEIITGINVTPMVDVAFVVLIIFIVTASLVLKKEIPVELPRAESGESLNPGLLNVAITAKGQIYINGKRAALDQLPDAVERSRAEAKKLGRKVSAFVAADVKSEYGTFAKVVDRLRVLGVVDIALDTSPLEEASGS